MNTMPPRHRLLERQIRVCTKEGALDVATLLRLVDAAYQNFDSISERKQRSLMIMSEELTTANQTLQAESLRLREFYGYAASSADIGLWEMNIPNQSVNCTQGVKDLLAYPEQEGEDMMSFVRRCFSAEAMAKFNQLIYSRVGNANRLIQIRTSVVVKDGRTRWVMVQGKVVKRDPQSGKPIAVAGILNDITDQVDHELALEKLNQLSAQVDITFDEKCRQILSLLCKAIGGDFASINQLEGDCIRVIHAVGSNTGMPVGTQNFVEKSLCMHAVGAADGIHAISDMAVEGYGDHPFHTQLGVEGYLGARIVVGGKTFGTLCMISATPIEFSDLNKNLLKITANWLGGHIELEQSKETLKHAHEKAVEANEAKSNFLATMSHEIRTPLNGIVSLVELLQESSVDAVQRERLDTVIRSCATLLSVITDVLDFSKIEAGKLDLEERPFDLTVTVRDVAGIFKPIADEKGLRLNMDVQLQAPSIFRGDENRLKQVLNNLLSNALKFCHYGKVQLSVNSVAKESQQWITFKVSDTGIGMSPGNVDQVFEKFTQADNSTTRKYGGTGLGLAIARQIVELMGGSIQIDSALGQGTLVTVQIPFEEADAGQLDSMRSAYSKDVRSYDGNILVVEDNAVNQYVIKTILMSLGCTVTLAGNGIEALSILQYRQFHLILMDMQMPEMDGVETTRQIRYKQLAPQIPIVALTANSLMDDRQRCFDAGMNEFVLKPITKSQIISVLDQFLPAAAR